MRKIWEKSWQNIPFNELSIQLSLLKRPTSNFYQEFYKFFFERYSSFNELPSNWRKAKLDTAQELKKIINAPGRVLAYGCGIGFIEFLLTKKMPNTCFDLLDFSENSFDFIEKVPNISCLLSIPDDNLYDVIYLTQVFYALSDTEIVDLLEDLRARLKPGGRLITFDTSSIPSENGLRLNFFQRVKKFLKDTLRPIYILLFGYKKYQFYGWYRSNEELLKLFTKADYLPVATKSGASQAINIFRDSSDLS